MSEEILQENKMGIVPIPKLLFSMALPAILSMTLQAVYNVVDSLFVAQISEDALAAVTLVFPIQMLVIAVGLGTGLGLSSLISRRLGEKRFDEANLAATHGFLLSFVSWIVFLIFTLFFSEMFYSAFSDNSTLVNQAVSYSNIVTGFSFFLFMEITLEKTLQSTGNMIIPMISSITGCIVNIILDPILIFGYFGMPAMGVAGAAIATVIGQFFGMVVVICVFFIKKQDVQIKLRGFRPSSEILKDIYTVGFPAMLMQAVPSFVNIALNALLISFSETAVSVLGVYFKLQSFIFMPVFGLNQSASPIEGYNYGAKNKERLMAALKLNLISAVIFMIIGFAIFQIFPSQIVSWFGRSNEFLSMGTSAMRIFSLCFVPAAFGTVFSTLFQALGRGTYSLIMTLLRQVIIVLPLSYILTKYIGVTGVWASYPIAEIFSVLCALILYGRLYRSDIKNLGKQADLNTSR